MSTMNLDQAFQPPSWEHLLGTDGFGRDLLHRLVLAVGVTTQVALVALVVSVMWALLVGTWLGSSKFILAEVGRWFLDALKSIPQILWVALFVVAFQELDHSLLDPLSLPVVVGIAMGCASWMQMAQMIGRSLAEHRRKTWYVSVELLGATPTYLFWKHQIPSLVKPLLVVVGQQLPAFMIFESFLSFAGLGLQAPSESLGVVLGESWSSFVHYPWLLIYPGLFLAVWVWTLTNLVQMGVRFFIPKSQIASWKFEKNESGSSQV